MAWRNSGRKYGNEKVQIDGYQFDSKKEARRFQELRLLEKAGAIKDLKMQVKYILIPEQRESDQRGPRGGIKRGRVIERELSYIADFVYFDNDKQMQIVEDVKGYRDPGSAAYAKFVIKRKMMLYKYGIRIKET